MELELHKMAVAEVEAEIASLEERLKFLRNVATYHRERAAGSSVQAGVVMQANIAARILEAMPDRRFRGLTAREAARIVLAEAEGPMRCAEIIDKLVEGGEVFTDRAKAVNSLFTTMTRAPDDFVKVKSGLWDLTSRVQARASERLTRFIDLQTSTPEELASKEGGVDS